MKNIVFEERYRVGDVLLRITLDDRTVRDMLYAWLCPFHVYGESSGDEIMIEISSITAETQFPSIPSQARLTYGGHTAHYYSFDKILIVDYPGWARVFVNKESDYAHGFVCVSRLKEYSWRLQDFFNTFFELFRRRGVYLYHSAAVSYKGAGLLIAGRSGRGKTTLSLNLLAHGFMFLSDDRCFLHQNDMKYKILGFPEDIRFYPQNVKDIGKWKNLGFDDSENKRVVKAKDVFLGQIETQAPLYRIIFPRWVPSEKTRIEPLPTKTALRELLPLTIECFDRETTQKHFDFNCRLVEDILCASISLGGDRENWSHIIQKYLNI